MRKKWTPTKVTCRILFWIALLLFALFILVPIYWCVVISLKSKAELSIRPATLLPSAMQFENYVNAWINSRFSDYFVNSAIIALLGVVGIIIVAFLTGYAMDRYNFKFKSAYTLILLSTQFIPGAVLVVPMYLFFKDLHLLNSLVGLAIVQVTFRFPYDSMLMKGFIHGIDYTIEEAAQIDGCSRISTIIRILVPLVKPGIATVAAYAFISCWNEFLYSYMFLSNKALFTLPVGLNHLIDPDGVTDYGGLAAGAIIAVLPTMLLFSYVQKNLVSGLTSGGVKG